MMRIAVVLPAPLGPRKPVTSPAFASKETSSTAVNGPYFLVNRSTVIMGDTLPHPGGARTWVMSLIPTPTSAAPTLTPLGVATLSTPAACTAALTVHRHK